MDIKPAILALVREGSDLTGRQLGVLFLCNGTQMTVRGLAEGLNVSKPAISRAVDKLVVARFLTRREDPSDRRSVLIGLTADGRKFVNRLMDRA